MYRKDGSLNFEYIKNMLEIKDVREMIVKEYIQYDKKLSKTIIELFKLKRINLKYVENLREYKDSYYSRNSLKSEEKIFIVEILLIRELAKEYNSFEKQKERVEKKVSMDEEFDAKIDLDFIKNYYEDNK